MILEQSKVLIKDNSSIKKIQCISTLNKKRIKTNVQFKAVVRNSLDNKNKRGQLANAILLNSSAYSHQTSGKVKKFDTNQAILIKELKKKTPSMLGSRITGIHNFNLRYLFERKIFSFYLCK